MPWYDGPEPAAPPRERPRRQRPQPHRRALPGAVRHPAAVRRVARLPRLRRAGRRRRPQEGRRGHGAAVAASPRRIASVETADGEVDEAYPADVGDGPARGRHRRLARRHDLPAAQPADRRPGRRRDDLLDGRDDAAAASAASTRIKHTTRTARDDRQGRCSYRLDVNTLHRDEAADRARRSTRSAGSGCARPCRCMCDEYCRNRTTGGFVLVDEATNRTVAAGMITDNVR